MPASTLQLLGTTRLLLPGGVDATPKPPKARALLGYLAMHPEGARRDRIASLLWGDVPVSQARTSLRQSLSSLRRALGPEHGAGLFADRDRVSLVLGDLQVDARQLMAVDVEASLPELRRALSLYRGALLEGLCAEEAAFETWRIGEQQRVRRALDALTEAAVARCRDAGDEEGALRLALDLINADWTRESAQRLVLEGYARTGQLTAARAHYRRFRAQLSASHGLTPSAATLAVVRDLARLEEEGASSDDASQAPSSEPRRRMLTVVFVRAIASASDPESNHRFLQEVWARAEAIAREGGAGECHPEADGLLCLWGAERATGEQADSAMQAAREIARAFDGGARVSLGVASGWVVPAPKLRPPFVGAPISGARGLASSASAGEVVECDETRAMRRATTPKVRLVGRDLESAQIEACFARALGSRRGAYLVVEGEAGIGKTRLVEEALARADTLEMKRIALHVAHSGEGDQDDLARALARALDALGETDALELCGDERAPSMRVLLDRGATQTDLAAVQAMDEDARERTRRELLLDLLHDAASSGPLAILIEDIHWASADELDGISSALDACRRLPLVVLATVRSEDEPESRAWQKTAYRSGVVRLQLGPLPPEEALDLAREFGASEGAADLASRSGGNPLFIEQLIGRDADELAQIPPTVRALVIARLDRLARQERQAVELAAVVGQRMARATGLALLRSEALDKLVDGGWLRVDGTDLRFSHALVRDAAYEAIHRDRRRSLHRDVAAYYRTNDLARCAEHLAHAGAEEAAEVFLLSAHAELERARTEAALASVMRGLALCDAGPVRARLARLAGDLHRRAGQVERALELFGEAESADAAETRLGALLGAAETLNTLERTNDAFARLERASAILDARPDELWRARIATLRGNFLFPSGDYAACAAAHAEALELARRAGSASAEARALSGLADAEYMRANLDRAAALFTEVAALSAKAGASSPELMARTMRGLLSNFLFRFAEAQRDLDWAIARAEELGDVRAEVVARSGAYFLHMARGDFERAHEEAERSVAGAQQIGGKRFEVCGFAYLARAKAMLGRREEGHRALRDAVERCAGAAEDFWKPACLAILASTAEDPRERRTFLEDAAAGRSRRCPVHTQIGFFTAALDTLLQDEAWEAAERLADECVAYAEAAPFAQATHIAARAKLCVALGRGERSSELAAASEALRARIDQHSLGDPHFVLASYPG